MTKKDIQNLIANNKLQAAIDALLPLAQGPDHKDLLVVQQRLKKLQRDEIRNIRDASEIQQAYTQVTYTLLKLTDNVFKPTPPPQANADQATPADAAPPPTPPSESSGPNFTNRPWWQWVITASILLGILASLAKITGFNLSHLFSASPTQPQTLTVLVSEVNEQPLPSKGEVHLSYGNSQISKTINNHGQAIFTDISPQFFASGQNVKISFTDPDGENYTALQADSQYQLQVGQRIELSVLLRGLDRLYGVTKDVASEALLDSVRVSVLDLATYSDANGWWELKIEDPLKQKRFHTLRASKAGYWLWEKGEVAAQVDREISILLNPKD